MNFTKITNLLQREEARGVEPSIQPRPPRSLRTPNECGRSPKWSISNPSKINEQQRCK